MVQQRGVGRGGDPDPAGAPEGGPPESLSPATGALLDPAALSEIRRLQLPGEPDVVATVIAMFADECPRQLQHLGAAIARQDPVALRAVAHNFKGSAATVGARHVRVLCQQMEDIGTAGTVVGAAGLAAALAEAAERTRTAWATLIASGELT